MWFRKILRKFLPKRAFDFIRDALYPEKIGVLEDRINTLLFLHYEDIASPQLSQKGAFRQAEFKVQSKHGCDGMLLYLFSKIGTTNRIFVEMGIETGQECNTANLALHFGWSGLLIDADKDFIRRAKAFYTEKLGDAVSRVKIAECFVTVDSINPLLKENDITGEIDLLSIDIDSNDYWVWQSITAIRPRVVVAEYNAAFGLEPLTIRYDPEFHYQSAHKGSPLYFGASLSALVKLAKSKGYILVACDSFGLDAYFVREDVVRNAFVELSPDEAFYANPINIANFGSLETQFNMIKHLDLERV